MGEAGEVGEAEEVGDEKFIDSADRADGVTGRNQKEWGRESWLKAIPIRFGNAIDKICRTLVQQGFYQSKITNLKSKMV